MKYFLCIPKCDCYHRKAQKNTKAIISIVSWMDHFIIEHLFFFSSLKEWVTKSAVSDGASGRHFLQNEQGELVMSRKTLVVFGAHDETWASMGKLELQKPQT